MKKKLQLALLFVLTIPCIVIAIRYNIDLVNIYAAAKFTATDLTRVYAYNGALGRYFYGPFSLVLINPMAYFSYTEVKYFWIFLQTLSYAVFWVFLYKLYPLLKKESFFWPWMLVFVVAINPIHNNYQSNNIQLMLMAVLVVAEVLTYSSSKYAQWLAGVLVVTTAAVKVFPLFLVAYYFFIKPRAVKAGVLSGVALTLVAPILYFGSANGLMLYKDFAMNLTTYSAENSLTKSGDIMSLPSMITRWMLAFEPPSGVWAGRIIKTLILAISGSFFFWTWNEKRQGRFEDTRIQIHGWAMAMALTVFLNPSTRPHYFIFYIPAFCSVLEIASEKKGKFLNFAAIVAMLLVAFTTDFVVGKNFNDRLESWSIPTLGFVLICIALFMAQRTAATPRSSPV